jgi:hypothetical protein
MKIKTAIIVITAVLAVFASLALAGTIVQKVEDAGVSTMDPGFVPSTGQINDGTSKLPS